MVVLLVISIILLIALPNITKQSGTINEKGCSALKQMVQGQVQAYYMENNKYPTIDELISAKYINEANKTCPSGKTLSVSSDGTVITN